MKRLSSMRTWILQDFNLCLFVNEAGDEETESESYRIKKTLPETNERKMEATSSQTQCPVFKGLQRHVGQRILTVLLVLTE